MLLGGEEERGVMGQGPQDKKKDTSTVYMWAFTVVNRAQIRFFETSLFFEERSLELIVLPLHNFFVEISGCTLFFVNCRITVLIKLNEESTSKTNGFKWAHLYKVRHKRVAFNDVPADCSSSSYQPLTGK